MRWPASENENERTVALPVDRRSARRVAGSAWVGLVLIGAVALRPAQDSGAVPASAVRPPGPGRSLLSVVHPRTPVFRIDDRGRPVVSAAGFVQVAADTPDTYDLFHRPERIQWARRSGRLDAVSWGEVEALCEVQRIATAWRSRTDGGSRLGIEEVSAEWGGFPDLDGDGVAEHLTHQLGTNINLLFPCRAQPEREIFFGRDNEELFDLALTREFVAILLARGARSLTTTSATRLLENVPGIPDLPGAFVLETVDETSGTAIWRNREQQAILLMKRPEDHGNHLNVDFSLLP